MPRKGSRPMTYASGTPDRRRATSDSARSEASGAAAPPAASTMRVASVAAASMPAPASRLVT